MLEQRNEGRNECGHWEGVLGRENSVCKALRWERNKGANEGVGGRRLLLRVQVRIVGNLE